MSQERGISRYEPLYINQTDNKVCGTARAAALSALQRPLLEKSRASNCITLLSPEPNPRKGRRQKSLAVR